MCYAISTAMVWRRTVFGRSGKEVVESCGPHAGSTNDGEASNDVQRRFWMEKKKTQKLSRREFLKVGAAGVGVAALGSMPQQVFGAAPAIKKGTKLTILQGTYFIAPGQDLYKKQAAEWGQVNGVEVSADFLNWPDLQPKIAAAIQAGGVDIVELWPSWNYLYRNNLVDMTKEAEEVGKRGGGFEKYVLNSAKMGNRWLGIPHGMSNASMAYRISWFKEAGVANAEDSAKVDLTSEQ